MNSSRKLPCPIRQTFKNYLIETGVDSEFKRVVNKLKQEDPLPDDPLKYIATIFNSINKKEATEAEKDKIKVVQGENKAIGNKIEKNKRKLEVLEGKIDVELRRLGLAD